MTELTDSNFEETISKGKVLVDFWAEWCGPCRAIAPLIEEVSKEAKNALIAKLDVDSNPSVTKRFGIRSIPTLILFENGIVKERYTGTMSKAELLKFVE